MQKLICGLLLCLAPVSAIYAETLSGSGGIYFTGVILARSCDVKESERNKSVNLGEYDRKLFKNVGDVTAAVPLNITLSDCQLNPHTSNILSISFKGNADEDEPQLLKVSTQDDNGDPLSGIASGVAIELMDSTEQNRIALNDVISIPMQAGEMSLPTVKLRYRATNMQVTPGQANAILWITLRYEE